MSSRCLYWPLCSGVSGKGSNVKARSLHAGEEEEENWRSGDGEEQRSEAWRGE